MNIKNPISTTLSSKRRVFLWVISLFIIFSSCKKKTDNPGTVPYIPVDITLYLADPSNFDLNFIGGYLYMIGGSRGIILYRYTQDQILAFDRHCPYDLDNPCGVVHVDSNAFLLVDDCCKSAFVITNGDVYKGPATIPLLQYRTFLDNSNNTVRIYN